MRIVFPQYAEKTKFFREISAKMPVQCNISEKSREIARESDFVIGIPPFFLVSNSLIF